MIIAYYGYVDRMERLFNCGFSIHPMGFERGSEHTFVATFLCCKDNETLTKEIIEYDQQKYAFATSAKLSAESTRDSVAAGVAVGDV